MRRTCFSTWLTSGTALLEFKIDSVNRILSDLEMNEIPTLLVLNKSDLLSPGETANLRKRYNGIAVSTLTKKGLPGLLKRIGKELKSESESGKPDPHN